MDGFDVKMVKKGRSYAEPMPTWVFKGTVKRFHNDKNR